MAPCALRFCSSAGSLASCFLFLASEDQPDQDGQPEHVDQKRNQTGTPEDDISDNQQEGNFFEKTDFEEKWFRLVEFSRASNAFEDVLLGSDLAVRCRQEGAELKPSWAHGAKMFYPGAQEDHFRGHHLNERMVAVKPEDESELLALPFQLQCHERPKWRRTNALPGEVAVASEPGSRQPCAAETEEVPYVVRNTFIHYIETNGEECQALQRSSSAPSLGVNGCQ